ncbi:MAG: glycosyltransferase family 2 protein [Flavobacteriales bacterium]
MKLSGVIITYNEARNIRRCLDSLLEVCDEILVLDSFSTDQTEAICLEYGVRFEKNAFEGHIQQKNEALRRATHSWVLSLDADEALSAPLKNCIIALKASNPAPAAFQMNRLTNYCGTWIKHSGWYPDTKVRLVYKELAHWGGVNPHDQLLPNQGLPVLLLQGDLLHYSYYTKADHFKQIAYFSQIAAKELFAKKIKSSWPKILLKVTAQFIKSYFIKLGFLDGLAGWHIATRSAFATYQKYSLLRKLWKNG